MTAVGMPMGWLNPTAAFVVLKGMMENQNDDKSHTADSTNQTRWGRTAGIILLVVIGLFLLIQLLFNFVAEPMLKDKLESAAASQHLTTEAGDMSLSLLQRQFRVNNLSAYQPDTSAVSPGSTQQPLDSLSVESISISGIGIFSYLFGNEIHANSISIEKPYILSRHPDTFGSGKGTSSGSGNKNAGSGSAANSGGQSGGSKTLYERIQSFADAVDIDEFSISGFTMEMDDDTTAERQAAIHNFNLQLSDIRIDSTSPQHRMMPASAVSGSLDSLHWQTSSGLYEFRSASIGFSSRDSLFETRNFSVHPRLPKYDFSMEKGHETDRIDLDINAFNINGIDLISLLERQEVRASAIHINGTELEIFHSMKPPSAKVKQKRFPHLQFREMKVPVAVDSLVIDNADISYGEHKNFVPEPGIVSFENTNGVFLNLYNNASSRPPQPITADVYSNLMGVGKMDVSFNFPPNKSGTHYISGSVGSMPITSLNPVLKYLAKVEVQEGQLDSIGFKMELGPESSTGLVKMEYSNFTINVLEFDQGGEGQPAELKSFLAGLVVDEGSTTAVQEGNVSFDRIKNKGIFNYWWKSLLSGLKSSIAF